MSEGILRGERDLSEMRRQRIIELEKSMSDMRTSGEMKGQPQAAREMTFIEWANSNRADIKRLGVRVLAMKGHKAFERSSLDPRGYDSGEMLSNIVLAYRHLEDAAMRLGKAIQAYDGGISVYDRKEDKDAVNKEGQEDKKGDG